MIKREDIRIRDPFILPLREEGKYYLYATNYNGVGDGFDCYVSDDLEHWEGPFPAFRADENFWANKHFWAAEVHLYKGKYYMFASFKRDGVCRGTQILVADNPKGPFLLHSDGPVTPRNWECLDGTLHIDKEGTPWMVFCHEWVQVNDGEICAVKLTDDLKFPIGEPKLLFYASEAPWVKAYSFDEKNGKGNFVTDGPFMYKNNEGELFMLWSSFGIDGYAIGVVRSSNGDIDGKWIHDKKPLYGKDGGHGMLFKTFDQKLMLTIHAPNKSTYERAAFFNIEEINGKLTIR